MKVFLHTDYCPGSEVWHNEFRKLLLRHKMAFVEVNLMTPGCIDFLEKEYETGDLFFGRIKHTQALLRIVKPMYGRICDLFRERCWPSRQEMDLYDDKCKQSMFFESKGYRTPKTYVLRASDEVFNFNRNDLYVVKLSHGASSENVRLIRPFEIERFPCVVQEYIKGNNFDYRIVTIGHRLTGYCRNNRANDFRASGSGRRFYPDEFDKDLIGEEKARTDMRTINQGVSRRDLRY